MDIKHSLKFNCLVKYTFYIISGTNKVLVLQINYNIILPLETPVKLLQMFY